MSTRYQLNDFPGGTIMAFQQTTAPTGWVKLTTHNDKALRVVTGTPSSGGATAFATVFGSGKTTGSYTLLEADIPGHTHTGASHTHTITHTHSAGSYVVPGPVNTTGTSPFAGAGTSVGSTSVTGTSGGSNSANTGAKTPGAGGSTGGDGGHSHTSSLDLQYVDIILAQKS